MVCFRATDGAVCVMDMGSAHGSFLNGRPCKRVRGVVACCSDSVPVAILYNKLEDAAQQPAGPGCRAEGRR